MAEWENGDSLGREDYACLGKAASQGLTLVTHDRRPIPSLLKAWAEEDREHGSIVFGDEKLFLQPTSVELRLIAGDNLDGSERLLGAFFSYFGHWLRHS